MLVSERKWEYLMNMKELLKLIKNIKLENLFLKFLDLDDPVIEINITPNRSDCLSVRGIARDLSCSWIRYFKRI